MQEKITLQIKNDKIRIYTQFAATSSESKTWFF